MLFFNTEATELAIFRSVVPPLIISPVEDTINVNQFIIAKLVFWYSVYENKKFLASFPVFSIRKRQSEPPDLSEYPTLQ